MASASTSPKKLLRTGRACAGNGLIGRNDHALYRGDRVERVDRSAGDDGGAVGVCDNALVLFNVLGVYLGNDEGNIRAEAERAGVVDKHRARGLDIIDEAFGNIVLGSAEDNVQPLEVFSARLDNDVAVYLLARRVAACKQPQLADGEAALGENFHHFLSDGAGRAENANVVFFHFDLTPYFTKLLYSTRTQLSKSSLFTPTMMFSSSGPWDIMRMLMPALPSAAKMRPEVPGLKAI